MKCFEVTKKRKTSNPISTPFQHSAFSTIFTLVRSEPPLSELPIILQTVPDLPFEFQRNQCYALEFKLPFEYEGKKFQTMYHLICYEKVRFL